MLLIKVSDIIDHSKELRRLIEAYETTSMSILQEVRNLDTEWHDDNSESFFSLSDTQKKEVIKFVSTIEDVCNRYDSISSATIAITGNVNKVFCNTENRGIVKNKYDSALSKINSMRDALNNCNTYFCTGGERASINSARSALNRAQSKVQSSCNRVDKLFSKLGKLEGTITSTLKGIDISPIPELDVSHFMK